MNDTIIINNNIIVNQTIKVIFDKMNSKYTLVYDLRKYIDIKYSELHHQFMIDYPRIDFNYKNKKVPLSIMNIYLKYKKKSIKKKIMLFCSQIIFAPILTDIHKVLMNINENYLIAELDKSDNVQKRVVTQISNGVVSTTKMLRIIDLSQDNKLVKKFIIHFTASIKTSNIIMLMIDFI